jgi:L-ascorbate metabolism protein UlaG (beta-lactamase superfamily)
MQITKYLHSCLLVEEKDTVILMDPGQYTYEANVLDINLLERLNYLLITHEHFDHFSLPFVKDITRKFPEVVTISTPSVVAQLEKESIPATTNGTYDIVTDPVPHEEILFFPRPENVKFTLFNTLTHPGDSFHFASDTEVIAMPMTAPWGSLVEAMKKLIELKPKVVIPIHDWHWKDEARHAFYPHVTDYFKQHKIDFRHIESGKTIGI